MSSSLSSNPDSSSTAPSSNASGRQSESTSSEAPSAERSSHSSSSGGGGVKPEAMAVSAAHHHQGPWPAAPLPSHHPMSLGGQQHGQEEDGQIGTRPNGQEAEGHHFSSSHYTHNNTSAQQYQSSPEALMEAPAGGSSSMAGAQRSPHPPNAPASSRSNQMAESPVQSRPPSVQFSNSYERSRRGQMGQANHASSGGPSRDSSALHASQSYNASQSTFAGGAWNQYDASSRDASSTATPLSRQPMQSRYFGLGPTLQMQNSLADPAYFPGGVIPPQSANAGGLETNDGTSGSKEIPGFSVELQARSFDHRGYPVYGGRAAPITGAIRMPKSDECDVTIKVSAHTTTGSTAMVWDGIALQPAANGSERVVFSATDTFPASEGHIDYSRASSSGPSTAASGSSTKAFAESNSEDGILVIPFTTNLPVGGSTRIVDGEVATVAVALPPSFEMSSDQDYKDKATLKSMSEAGGAIGSSAASVRTKMTRMTATTVREAVEAGLRQVYRIGCFYRITFTLVPVGGKVQESGRKLAGALFGSKKSKAAKKLKGSRTLSIPFVFLGEIVSQPPIPSILPPLRPAILKQPSQLLAPQWESDVATAQWSGKFFKTMKRNVQLELFLPSKTVQAPSVVPVLLVIRPEDPEMLPKPVIACSSSPVGSPRPGVTRGNSAESAVVLQGSRIPAINSGSNGPSSTAGGTGGPPGVKAGSAEPRKEGDEAAQKGQGSSDLSHTLQSSMSISESPAHATSASNPAAPSASGPSHKDPAQRLHKKISRSTFSFNKRPESALSRASSDESSISYTIRGGGAPGSVQGDGAAQAGLPSLVRLSILQNVYYNSSNVNEPPKNKRRLMNVADLEEIDLGRLANEHGYGDLSLLYDVPNAVALVADAKVSGVRVLRGVLRIPREATPSFRVQGIEVKYAIKVDLLPFNSRAGAKSGSAVLPSRTNASMSFPSSSASSMRPGSSSSPPVTPPYHPSPLAFGSRGPAGAIKPSQQQQQQLDGGPSNSSHQAPSSSTSTSQTIWTPGAAVPLGLHSHTYDSSVRMSQAGSSAGTIGAAGSVIGGRGRTSFDTSEAGFSRRSPSDPTIIGGADSSKLQKTVGALWVNVRLVKGKGSL